MCTNPQLAYDTMERTMRNVHAQVDMLMLALLEQHSLCDGAIAGVRGEIEKVLSEIEHFRMSNLLYGARHEVTLTIEDEEIYRRNKAEIDAQVVSANEPMPGEAIAKSLGKLLGLDMKYVPGIGAVGLMTVGDSEDEPDAN
jgi:hypothetical protein